MNIIDKSIKTAQQLLPDIRASRIGTKEYHLSFLYRKARLLSIGINNPDIEDIKTIKIGKILGANYKFQRLHSELSAIGKLWGRYHIDGAITLINIRMNRFGDLGLSKPCNNCQIVLNALGIYKIWYSCSNGKFEELNE